MLVLVAVLGFCIAGAIGNMRVGSNELANQLLLSADERIRTGRLDDVFELDSTTKNYIVDLHNQLRKSVQPPAQNMLRMRWNEELARLADDWSRNCRFMHRPRHGNESSCGIAGYSQVGECMTAAFLFDDLRDHTNNATTQKRIRQKFLEAIANTSFSWWAEKDDYDFATDTCKPGKICGHYTQVVWAKTYEVGCGISQCQGIEGYDLNVKGNFLVCNYGPAGNFVGERPYVAGNACAACPNNCTNGLCDPQPRYTVCTDLQPVACKVWKQKPDIGCNLCDSNGQPNIYVDFMGQQCAKSCGFC